MVRTWLAAAIATTCLLQVGAAAAHSGTAPAVVKRGVVLSDNVWTELREEPSEEQIPIADHRKLVVDARTPGVLVFSLKMAAIPETPMGEPGFHGWYSASFTTVNRRGGAPIYGNLSLGTFEGQYVATSDVNEAGFPWPQPCPGTGQIDPNTEWVTFTVTKACFPGDHRRIISYGADTRSGNYVVRSDGVADDTSDVAIDRTEPRKQQIIRIR